MIGKQEIINLLKKKSEKIKTIREEVKHGNQYNYLQNRQTLTVIIQSIISLFQQKKIQDRILALEQAYQLIISADLKAVKAIYEYIVPKIIRQQSELKQIGLQYLKIWSLMYNGKNATILYPDFTQFHQNIKNTKVNTQLMKKFQEFQKNINRKNEEKVQFFEQSFITYTQNEQESKVIQIATLNMAQIQKIRQKLTNQNLNLNFYQLQEFKNKIQQFKRENYKIKYDSIANLCDGDSVKKIKIRLEQESKWCQKYIELYQKLKTKQIDAKEFVDQLKISQIEQFSNITFVPLKKQNRFTEIHKNSVPTIPINTIKPSNFQKKIDIFPHQLDKNNESFDQAQLFIGTQEKILKNNIFKMRKTSPIFEIKDQQQQQFTPKLVITKYKPTFSQQLIASNDSSKSPFSSTERTKQRKKIFKSSPNQKKEPQQISQFRNTYNCAIKTPTTIKLSDFTNEKQRRRLQVNLIQFDKAPDWFISPFMNNFQTQSQYSRFRKTCLIKKGELCNYHQNLKVHYQFQRDSAQQITVTIKYINISNQTKDLKTIYKIGKSFEVCQPKNVNAKFILKKQQTHKFSLKIKQFPLNICFLQLSVGKKGKRIQQTITLPITLMNYMTFQYLEKDYWYSEWNKYQNKEFYKTQKKIQYNKKILTVSQMSLLFPEFSELRGKFNYFNQQFGCKCRYEYYNLEFLILICFNVQNVVTIRMNCCHEISENQQQFINYFTNILIMLLEKIDSE